LIADNSRRIDDRATGKRMPSDKIRKVLFISADQWRGECLSALDHACVRTPNLDALAAIACCSATTIAKPARAARRGPAC